MKIIAMKLSLYSELSCSPYAGNFGIKDHGIFDQINTIKFNFIERVV